MLPAIGSRWKIPPIRVHRPGRSGWVEWVSLLMNFRKCVPTWDTKKEGCAFTGKLPAVVQSSSLARGAVKHPLGVSSPCLQHFRRAAAVKARPVRRLVGSVGDCVKQSPSLDGRCSAEYPPRRGVTPRLRSLFIGPVSGHFSLCYLPLRCILPRVRLGGVIFLSMEPPMLLLMS